MADRPPGERSTVPHESSFRVGFVPGVTLTKWSRVWADRHPSTPLELSVIDAQEPTARLDDDLAMVFARLPIPPDGFHAIRLYDEQPYVVLPKGHVLAELDELEPADLDGEARFDQDDSLTPEAQVEVVATGAGVAVMPQSLARLHSRKDVVSRPLVGVEPTTIALVWPEGRESAEIDDFIGIVRGRTANSSRGAQAQAASEPRAAPGRSSAPRGSGAGRTAAPRAAAAARAAARRRKKR